MVNIRIIYRPNELMKNFCLASMELTYFERIRKKMNIYIYTLPLLLRIAK